MEYYRGTLSGLTYVFINYVSLSGPPVIVSMLSGAISAVMSIAMVPVRPLRRYAVIALILAVAAVIIGFAGSVSNIMALDMASRMEIGAGIAPSAPQYYSAECGYNKISFCAFPAIVGIASAMPSFLIAATMLRNVRRK